VDWPASYTWSARQYRRGYAGPSAWMGSLIFESRDASGLYYRRNRYYDSEKGQFTQEDPIGLAGGINVYGFANGDPISYRDPYGLSAQGNCEPFCTAVDVAFLAADINDARKNGLGWRNGIGIGLGVVSVALPLVTGLGALDDVAKAADRGADFIVTSRGTAVPTSQARMRAGFDNAGFPSRPTRSLGVEHTLPSGNRVRTMEPAGKAPRRASFENRNGQPVTPDGTVPQPPKGATRAERTEHVRARTHVEQTP
jgi:RHS repeat-associated protein